MKQFSWNHIDQRGKIHKVGLLHGSNTGHVLIHVNGKISSIDFKVLDTKQYSFFIDEEMIELKIIRHEDHFEYTMEINEEIQTPLNKQRKKEQKKMGFQTLAFFGFMVLAISAGTWWMMQSDWYKIKNNAQFEYLDTLGKYTKARLYEHNSDYYKYEFVTHENEIISGKAPHTNYPIQNGDQYLVQYLPHNPETNKVIFAKPTKAQIKKAMANSVRICTKSDETMDEGRCNCLVEAVFEIGGYKGLMAYINRDVLSRDNPQFNSDSFRQMVGSQKYRELHQRVCGK